jgi:hypothetical protein
LAALSGPRLTRRLSFSNWSMDSWRTMPRREPEGGVRSLYVGAPLLLRRTAPCARPHPSVCVARAAHTRPACFTHRASPGRPPQRGGTGARQA